MANIIVTSTTNCINVEFNSTSSVSGYKKANFNKDQITFQLRENEECVRVFDSWGVNWCVTYPTNPALLSGLEALPIDSVDSSSAPTSNDELYTLLINMKG